MTCEFEISKSDLIRSAFWQLYRRWSIRLIYIGLMLALLFAGWRIPVEGLPRNSWRALIPLILFVVLIPGSAYWSGRSSYMNMKPGQRKIRYEIDESGLRLKSELASSSISWEAVHSIIETNSYFYLGFQKYLFHILPKRGFLGDSDLRAFRSLVRTKLNAGVRIHRDDTVKQRG